MLIIGMGACLGLNPVWFANPLTWIGTWLLVQRRWTGAGVVNGSRNTFLIGYYVWLTSSAVLAVAALVGRVQFGSRRSESCHEAQNLGELGEGRK